MGPAGKRSHKMSLFLIFHNKHQMHARMSKKLRYTRYLSVFQILSDVFHVSSLFTHDEIKISTTITANYNTILQSEDYLD